MIIQQLRNLCNVILPKVVEFIVKMCLSGGQQMIAHNLTEPRNKFLFLVEKK